MVQLHVFHFHYETCIPTLSCLRGRLFILYELLRSGFVNRYDEWVRPWENIELQHIVSSFTYRKSLKRNPRTSTLTRTPWWSRIPADFSDLTDSIPTLPWLRYNIHNYLPSCILVPLLVPHDTMTPDISGLLSIFTIRYYFIHFIHWVVLKLIYDYGGQVISTKDDVNYVIAVERVKDNFWIETKSKAVEF